MSQIASQETQIKGGKIAGHAPKARQLNNLIVHSDKGQLALE